MAASTVTSGGVIYALLEPACKIESMDALRMSSSSIGVEGVSVPASSGGLVEGRSISLGSN